MDKRARLLSDLRQLGSSGSGISSGTTFGDVHLSDLELSEDEMELADKSGVDDDSGSVFSDDSSDAEDDFEAHLKLLWPRELENLGKEALRKHQYEAAIKYLNMARLEWTQTLVKQLMLGNQPVQLEREALADDWILGKYIQLANSRAGFVERDVLMKEFEATARRALVATAALCRPPCDATCSESALQRAPLSCPPERY